MDGLDVTAEVGINVLHVIIAGTLASTTIGWWIWVVHSTLGQLRSNQVGFVELLFECFRSLCVVLVILTIIAFV